MVPFVLDVWLEYSLNFRLTETEKKVSAEAEPRPRLDLD